MKIDHDYLKRLLDACQSSANPTFDVNDLKAAGFDYADSLFEFHMAILADQDFIQRDDGRAGVGLLKGAGGFPMWSVTPLRLTAAGHQFVEALSNKEVWHKLKDGFRGASIATLKDVALKLLEGIARKKVDELLK